MSLEGYSFSTSNLNISTTDAILIDVALCDKEIEKRKHKYLYKHILNKIKLTPVIILISATGSMAFWYF